MPVQAEVVSCTGAHVWQLRADVPMLSIRCGMHSYTPENTATGLLPFLSCVGCVLQHLIPEVTDVTLGNYAGAIPTAMFAGRFFSRCIWVLLASDHTLVSVYYTFCMPCLHNLYDSTMCVSPSTGCVVYVPLCYQLVVWFCIPSIRIHIRTYKECVDRMNGVV